MRELLDKLLNDEGLQALLTKAQRAEPGKINLFEYRATKWGASTHLINYYNKLVDYKADITPEFRARCSNRLLAANGNSRYEALTDIVDGAEEAKKGTWAIMGYGAENDLQERPFIYKEFPTREALQAEEKEHFKQINGWAIVHQYGTTDYTFVKTQLLSGIQFEITTEGLDQELDEIRRVASKYEREMAEPEIPLTDGEIIDLD